MTKENRPDPFGDFMKTQGIKVVDVIPTQDKRCNCEEMTCKDGCTKNHTHKQFWCEKCQPQDESACPHNNIESNMCPTHCKDCGKVLDESTNYMDARTPEEREAENKIEVTMTTSSDESTNEKSKCCNAPSSLSVSTLKGRRKLCNNCGNNFTPTDKKEGQYINFARDVIN